MPEDILSTIIDIIAETTGEERASVQLESTFQEDLGVSSLAAVEIMAAVTSRFEVVINEEDLIGLETVKDLVELVEVQRRQA